jgi:adenylate cyclase
VQGKVANATIVRPLADFTAQYRIEGLAIPSASRREASPELDYAQRIVSLMTRLASLLISADVVPEVLERAMGIAFEALTVDRGFILLRDDDGQVRCALARWGDQVEHSPQEEVPVSRTIVETVMEDRVALLTHDALADERFALGESIRVHGIRSAMCVPLWSGERIIGVLQVDSPLLVGRFEQRDLDFVTAVANYTAVAVERLRNGERIQVEQRLRSRLERYHSPVVIEEILKQEESAGPAGLRMTEATVLFADLVGFTALAEELPATEVADLLRNFFNDAADAIFATSGTLDKFIGDCVMAFFGAPIEQPDHAQRAVRAALAILEAQAERNERRQEQGLSPLLCRIAINSGPVVVGDVGSDGRVDYTVLGNTVNVAARLEQSVAEAGQVVIGPETSRLLAGAWPLVSLGPQRLKGLQQTITAYRVLEPEKP